MRTHYLLIAGLCIGLANPAHAEDYKSYENPRFGAVADIPGSWKADPAPDNGDGLTFRSPDGAATVSVYGILNVDDSIEDAIKTQQEANEGETITLHKRGKQTVTVSGTKGNKIFYRKSVLVCGNQIWTGISIEYPAARKSEYDAVVTHAAHSLHFSGHSAQVDSCS